VLALLADGTPRTKKAILAARHAKDEVKRALMHLVATARLADRGGKFALPRLTTRSRGRRGVPRADYRRRRSGRRRLGHGHAAGASFLPGWRAPAKTRACAPHRA
jgi:hypothetical protein